jgi:FtsP/CotA-like multicopper oxidase with cupredoxin domain
VTERISRRGVLQYGLGAVAVGQAAAGLRTDWLGGNATTWPGAVAARRNELRPPRTLTSRTGKLHVRLTCTPAVVHMGAPQPVRTYTYDGVVPGHTWEVDAGDTLVVDLVNRLPPLPGDHDMTMVRPHEWTTTNLHTHGLHVSPRGTGDNVFLSIPPGERQRYEIPIPGDHPAGLFWYHPHRHGAVTQQVRAGMAGMIIVRGDLDAVPEVRAARERIMVLQAIELGRDYALMDPIPDPAKQQAFFPRENVLYTVNGKLKPKIGRAHV